MVQGSTSQALVQAFGGLFPGLSKARGGLRGVCIKEPLTQRNYARHLDGVESLGVYPLREDGRCKWGAVDIDEGDDPGSAIRVLGALSDLGLHPGCYLARSRSKGWHVLVFFSDWVLAHGVRRVLTAAVAAAHLDPRTEVFPKQDALPSNGFGNYLNLPYFARHNRDGRRMLYDLKHLEPIPFAAWISNVSTFPSEYLTLVLGNASPKPEARISHKATSNMGLLFTSTYGEGFRRAGSGLPSAVGTLRRRGIDEEGAVALLVPWAREHFDPPLPDEEVEHHVRAMYERYGLPRRGNRKRTGARLPEIEVTL